MSNPTQLRQQRTELARKARKDWEAAIDAGLPHYEVEVRWDAYTKLAHLAGVFLQLEHEAARERGRWGTSVPPTP